MGITTDASPGRRGRTDGAVRGARGAIALSAWVATVALVAAYGVLAAARLSLMGGVLVNFAQEAFAAVVFSSIGLVIASRRPENRVGWIFAAVGLSFALSAAAGGLETGLPPGAPHMPWGADVGGWLNQWVWIPGYFLTASFLILLFPDGKLPSRRWRPVAWLSAAFIALTLAGEFLSPDGLGTVTPGFNNPVATLPKAVDVLGIVGVPGLVACATLSIAAIVLRFRRSRGVERQQLKWFTWGAVATVVLGAAGLNISARSAWQYALGFLAILPIPAASMVAILRYRLYDIDRVINRTLVYTALSAILVGVYAGLVLGLEVVVGSGDAVVVAGSTLVVAGLANPLRRRLQSLIDRRFYRRRYDAERTLAVFGARMRAQVDLDELTAHLVAAMGETVQPAHASLWLRPTVSARREEGA